MGHGAPPWWAYACLAASMALVGSYVGFSKLMVAVFPVFLLAWLRFGIGAVAMAHWLARAPGEAPLSARDRRLLFVESLFGNFLFSVCMLFGVRYSSALSAGVILAALPAVVALLSWWLLGERPAARVRIGVGCAVGGIALASASAARDDGAAGSMLGPLLLVGALVCEAIYVVIGKKLTANVSAKRIGAIVNLWGLALMTPFGVWQALGFDFAGVPPTLWVMLVFYALAASVWTVWLWMTGLAKVPASSAGVYTVWLPISAAIVGVAVLDEVLGPMQAAAFGLALVGVVLATAARR